MGNHRADRRGARRDPSEQSTASTGGKRRAVKPARHTGSRGSLFKSLPSTPVLVGVAALAVSAGGAVTAAGAGLSSPDQPRFSQASALSGASDVSRVSLVKARTAAISRDSRRDALADKADDQLVAEAEQQAQQRDAGLAQLAQQAETQAKKLARDAWVLPLDSYHLTARFGESSGLWAHLHTGLDFAAPTGTPIHAVAAGTVTSTGYDGSYGNKTVVTLEDGTELWYCHQNAFGVSVGDVVSPGDLIGYVGSTGNVTGPHLHLEVRPGGGDPVDPYDALVHHGVQP
jgi:murein DD-endopeptidase MepM/ murein hydrolase activator NlpD